MTRPLRLSFRARIMLLVLGVALLPLVVIGTWITGTAARSGEELLRARLRQTLDEASAEIGVQWMRQRSRLLDLAEHPELHRLVRRPAAGETDAQPPPELLRALGRLDTLVLGVVVRDMEGATRWEWSSAERSSSAVSAFATSFELRARGGTDILGLLEVILSPSQLLGRQPVTPLMPGVVFAALQADSREPIVPAPVDASFLRMRQFRLVHEDWVVERRVLLDPPLELVAAAPLTPYMQPFQHASRRALLVLFAAAAAALLVAAWLTSHMTRALNRLVTATERIRPGAIPARMEAVRGDEFGRVASAFNAMSERLDATVAELARRESVAAVGEFAAELAHEVRNPLTAMRVNMQVAQEQLLQGSAAHEAQRAALEEIDRLERTVAGALRLARSGSVQRTVIDLRAPLEAALRAARPLVERQGATLHASALVPLPVSGDADALPDAAEPARECRAGGSCRRQRARCRGA
jgi:signal transduction histidine kinase